MLRLGAGDFPPFILRLLVPFHCVAAGLFLLLRRRRRLAQPGGILDRMLVFDDRNLAALRTLPLRPATVFVVALGGAPSWPSS